MLSTGPLERDQRKKNYLAREERKRLDGLPFAYPNDLSYYHRLEWEIYGKNKLGDPMGIEHGFVLD